MVRQGKKMRNILRQKDIVQLRKKRDIARAYQLKEGSIAVLAERYHASSRTVQEAIKHDADWWQEQIAQALPSELQDSSPPTLPTSFDTLVLPPTLPSPALPFEQWLLRLEHMRGLEGRGGYQVYKDKQPIAMVEGSINDVLARLAADGWEVLQVVAKGDEWSDVLVRRHA
jgi:hypothetical protein